jgi:hypothetical protein
MCCQSVVRVEPYESLHKNIEQAFGLGGGDYYMSIAWRQVVLGRTSPLVYDLQPSSQMQCSFCVLACESLVREEKQTCHEHQHPCCWAKDR